MIRQNIYPSTSLVRRYRDRVASNYGTFRGWVRHALAASEYLLGCHSQWVVEPAKPVRRLVFVCLGNINRSAFAGEVARSLGMNVISIGLSTTTGAPATDMAQAQARRQGFGLEAHRATNFNDYRFENGDLLLVMEIRHARELIAHGIPSDAIRLLGHWASPARLHLHDPHTLSAAYFSTCLSLIESAVRNLKRCLEGNEEIAVTQPIPRSENSRAGSSQL